MCGRFTLKSPGRIKFDHVAKSDLPALVPRYNIAPSQTILAITQRDSDPEATLLQWGLIPSWSKEPKGFINARAETIEQKRSFSESFQRRRCLIPADGFYEWRRAGRSKQAYYFQLRDEAPFAFAGLWDRWRNYGMSISSCSIITTTANELLAPIHDRMPVILGPDAYEAWLSPEALPSALKDLLVPLPAAEMKSHPVGSGVNYPENDSEDLIQRVDVEVGTTPSLF
jgi:putative SOS response-associated peptidase YedK